jgi:glycosyltransferase involved in cell wall biosynthesis
MSTVTTRKPYIVLVGHYLGEEVFGAERSLLDVLAAVDRERYDLSCVLPARNDAYLAAVAKYTDNITVFPYRWSNKAPDEATVARFEAIFRHARADLIHVNSNTLMDPLLAARRLGVPNAVHAREFVSVHDDLAKILGHDPPGVVRAIKAAADFIIATSDTTRELYGKQATSFRLYDTVDVERLDLPNDLEPGTLKVGILNNNQAKKGIERFVSLAVLAGRRRPDLQFIVFGPRTEHVDMLERRVRGEGHPVNLTFAEYVADPVDAIRQVNVIFSFSIVAEAFGRTIAEAMAARRPVIAYDHGAAPELVRHETDGFIVPYLDIEMALEHLGGLADHPDRVLAMGCNGRQRAQELFAPEVFAPQLNGIYRQILQAWEIRGREVVG